MATILPTIASAQTLPNPVQTRYRLVPIPYDAIDGCTDRSETVGLGLNDCGEVTGFIEFDHSPCSGHPFFYSFCANNYLIPSQTTRDLAKLASHATWFGKAHEIDNAGVISGWLGAAVIPPEGTSGTPWLWKMASYSPTLDRVTVNFTLGSGLLGEAMSVNSEADPLLVGYTLSNDPTPKKLAFRSRLSAGGAITAVPLAPSDPESFAMDVNTPASGQSPRAAGGSIGFTLFPDPPCGALTVDDALIWTIGTTTTVSQLTESSTTASIFNLWQASSLAVNAAGDSAGWRSQNFDCVHRAVVWIGGSPIDLGFLAPIPSDGRTEVRGMTGADSAGALQLVGTDTLYAKAWIWWRSSSTTAFAAVPMSSLCLLVPIGMPFNELSELNDVNKWGWMVGTAKLNGAPAKQAVLLIPQLCLYDLNFNGITDGADLSIVTGSWGPCPAGASCLADLDCDHTVGPADLGMILGAWGTLCDPPCVMAGCPQGGSSEAMASNGAEVAMQEGAESAPTSAVSLAAAAYGFESVALFSAWVGSLPATEALAVADVVAALVEQNGGDV